MKTIKNEINKVVDNILYSIKQQKKIHFNTSIYNEKQTISFWYLF